MEFLSGSSTFPFYRFSLPPPVVQLWRCSWPSPHSQTDPESDLSRDTWGGPGTEISANRHRANRYNILYNHLFIMFYHNTLLCETSVINDIFFFFLHCHYTAVMLQLYKVKLWHNGLLASLRYIIQPCVKSLCNVTQSHDDLNPVQLLLASELWHVDESTTVSQRKCHKNH